LLLSGTDSFPEEGKVWFSRSKQFSVLFSSAHAGTTLPQPILGLNYNPMPAQDGWAEADAFLIFQLVLGLIMTSTCGVSCWALS